MSVTHMDVRGHHSDGRPPGRGGTTRSATPPDAHSPSPGAVAEQISVSVEGRLPSEYAGAKSLSWSESAESTETAVA